MKHRNAVLIRYGIILLTAVFALSGSLYSQDGTKGKAAKSPCVKGNCVNGTGEMNFASGDSYKGSFVNGKIHGQGEMTWKKGDKYRGSWYAGKMEGRGEMKWAIGDKYYGFWKDNLMDGDGDMTWKNGTRYIGQWKNGKQHGKGVLITTDKKNVTGMWENGKQVSVLAKVGRIIVAGTWKKLCLQSPWSTEYEDDNMTLVLNANKTGVSKSTSRETGQARETPLTWQLNGSDLRLTWTIKGEDPVTHDYTYDGTEKVFKTAPQPMGDKTVSRCMLKKQ